MTPEIQPLRFSRILQITTLGLFAGLGIHNAALAEGPAQHYEVRSYLLSESGEGSAEDEQAIDRYLRDALLPALGRHGIGPVGVFRNAANDETGSPRIVVVIPFDDPAEFAPLRSKIATDAGYRAAAKEYLGRGPKESPYQRIQSEWLIAMDCMPRMDVPKGTLENDARVYELRVYESANERLGQLKVDMFNAGEVPIFLDSGIQPIFIGQALIGPQLPSLTYLTVYPSEEARLRAWDTFRSHPDWKVLSRDPKYAGTVSRIDKFVLVAKPYSQM